MQRCIGNLERVFTLTLNKAVFVVMVPSPSLECMGLRVKKRHYTFFVYVHGVMVLAFASYRHAFVLFRLVKKNTNGRTHS